MKNSAILAAIATFATVVGGLIYWSKQPASALGPKAPWEPSNFKGGSTSDYLAFVTDNYYAPDGSSLVLDARDARANANYIGASATYSPIDEFGNLYSATGADVRARR